MWFATAIDPSILAALIGGLFLTINTVITLVVTRYERKDENDPDRRSGSDRRRRGNRADSGTDSASGSNRSPHKGKDSGTKRYVLSPKGNGAYCHP